LELRVAVLLQRAVLLARSQLQVASEHQQHLLAAVSEFKQGSEHRQPNNQSLVVFSELHNNNQ